LIRVVIIGCGIVGAAIAYELSQVPGLTVSVLDPHPPAQGATGAALGVLMAVISQKLKGRLLQLRLASLERYETLIPELEQQLHQPIPYNRSGILKLYTSTVETEQSQVLIPARAAQGWQLESIPPDELQARYPRVKGAHGYGALYSPCDRQVHPVALTKALVQVAQQNGVSVQWGVAAQRLEFSSAESAESRHCNAVVTDQQPFAADWVVICAGIESTALLRSLHHPLEIHPVLGQALKIKLPQGLEHPEPVITADDVHVVPLGQGEYWVGATVEFGAGEQPPPPDPNGIQILLQRATEFYPRLRSGEIVQTWVGLRPRPFERSAPVIEALAGYDNVLLATGHYRNGILLAPITALHIKAMLCARIGQEFQ
jgi:glycine oxidase